MTTTPTNNRALPSFAASADDVPLGPRHAELLAFLAARGRVAFDAAQAGRARALAAAARDELLGPLPAGTAATVLDGWVRRITLSCRDARALWPELAARPPALARLEEIELVLDEELEGWRAVAADQPLDVTRYYLDAEYVDPDTGECLDLSDGAARVVAAAAALPHATELVFDLYLDESSSFAALELPALTALTVRSLSGSAFEHDARALATLWKARCPQLRRLAWESFAPLAPAVAVAAPAHVTELGFWGPSHPAVLAALAARRPDLTALGVAELAGDRLDDLDDDDLRRVGAGRRLFGPRCNYVGGFNAGHRLLHALGRKADAAAQFAWLRARNPDDADVHFQYGNALDDDHARVAAYCDALTVDPDHGPAHANLGAALLRLGQPRAAIDHLRRYLADEPGFAGGWRNLAAAHRALGEEAEALAAEARVPPE